MKKVFAYVLAASALSMSIVLAKELVCFDSMRILQEAKENQKIAGELNGKIEELQIFVKDSQQKLVDMQSELDKKSSILSKEALQEKTEEIVQKKKDFERIIADRKDKLEKDIQKRQVALRTKQIGVINQVCKREDLGVLVDKNAPGVVYVSDDIDRTDLFIQEINKAYDVENASKGAGKKVQSKAAAAKIEKKA